MLDDKPTIEELQAILDSNEELRIEVLPNGSIQAVPASFPPLVSVSPRIYTLEEALGDDY